MSSIDVIAALVSSDPTQYPQQLLYEFLEDNKVVRLNEFCRFCQSRGVDMVAEEALDILALDPHYLFTEEQDAAGRYWTADIAEGYVSYQNQAGPYGEGTSDIPDAFGQEQGGLEGIDETGVDEVGLLNHDDLTDEIAQAVNDVLIHE